MAHFKMDPQLEGVVEVHSFSQTNVKFDPLSLHSHFIFTHETAEYIPSTIYLDKDLCMKDHINFICKTAFLEIRRISTIRHYLTDDATKTLVVSLVLSRIDYCNSLLVGLPQSLVGKLKRVQNSAARLVVRALPHVHITPILRHLHWLPVRARIS